jgi:hypothetical protein
MTKAVARKFFREALMHVESKSIRAWASSEHNLPIWIEITKSWLTKHGQSEETRMRLTIDIVSQAIGL